jgi:hypothetical protein
MEVRATIMRNAAVPNTARKRFAVTSEFAMTANANAR